MQLGEYYKIRTGVQRNAHPADPNALATVEETLEKALNDSGLFHSVEVGSTDDEDRLVIAMVGFAPGADLNLVTGELERLWIDRVGYSFWAAHSTLRERGQIELLGSTRSSSTGHYVTLHVIAQQSEVPAQRFAPAPAPVRVEPVAEQWTPSGGRSWGRLLGRPVLAPA